MPDLDLPWTDDTRKLKNWFVVYLIVWVLGVYMVIAPQFRTVWPLLASFIAGALLLNPYLVGFVIPASVLWTTARINRKIHDGTLPMPATRSVS